MQWSCGLLFRAHLSLRSAQLLWHTWSRGGPLVMAGWPPGELTRKHLGCWETRDSSGSSTERCLGLLGDITYPLAAMLAGLCPWATMAVDSWLHFWLKILLYVGTTDVVKHSWSNRYSWRVSKNVRHGCPVEHIGIGSLTIPMWEGSEGLTVWLFNSLGCWPNSQSCKLLDYMRLQTGRGRNQKKTKHLS